MHFARSVSKIRTGTLEKVNKSTHLTMKSKQVTACKEFTKRELLLEVGKIVWGIQHSHRKMAA